MAWSCDRIVRGLRHRDVTVDVVHLTTATDRWSATTTTGGSHRRIPLGDDPEHALRRAFAELAAVAPDPGWTHIVAFGGTWPMLAAPVWAAWLALPLVTLLRGNDFDTGVLSLRRRAATVDCLTRSAVVCTVARSQARLVATLVPGVEVRVVANGIDLTDWVALPSERERARAWRAQHVAEGRRTIGLVGHLKAKKGTDWFVDRIDDTGLADRVHLVLAGETDEATARRLADPPLGLAATHLGFLDRFELLSVLPACDLVAVPSFYDGLPNVALEAAGLGVPLLCSDAGGLADLVGDGVEGFRFPAGDAAGATQAIVRSIEAGRPRLEALGAAARRRVEADFGAEREIDGYLDLLAATARR